MTNLINNPCNFWVTNEVMEQLRQTHPDVLNETRKATDITDDECLELIDEIIDEYIVRHGA